MPLTIIQDSPLRGLGVEAQTSPKYGFYLGLTKAIGLTPLTVSFVCPFEARSRVPEQRHGQYNFSSELLKQPRISFIPLAIENRNYVASASLLGNVESEPLDSKRRREEHCKRR